ncbi:PRKCA-binding protein [Cichlidogyrus casuarinus]|uniref:PRKCA-binding protein n=1 Tax=Cichlidogyrus casuarinus TaxID=1844966 RepID=A0ABD2PZQ0_9PLAT
MLFTYFPEIPNAFYAKKFFLDIHLKMDYSDMFLYEEDRLGMRVSTGHALLIKDSQNQVGLSISGGAPYCPCVYVVQIFDGTPAAEDGSLQAGDEITSVNGISVKGRNKSEVARLFQTGKKEVSICYNKLHADLKQGKSLDILLKKIKHKAVEKMDSSTADALGLSRAILVNDDLVKKVEKLNATSDMFCGLISHIKSLLRAIYNLSRVYRSYSNTFAQIGVMEPQASANEAFCHFGQVHRDMERYSIDMIKHLKPMITDLNTFLTKAVPDTHLTMKKYLDAKFEYLSYCLKVKEMDEEEYNYGLMQEPLYRVETGNYEYRLILRCRHDAHVVSQLKRFVNAMAEYHQKCAVAMQDAQIFPIELELSNNTFAYKGDQINTGESSSSDEYVEPEASVNEPSFLALEDNTDDLLGDLKDLSIVQQQQQSLLDEELFGVAPPINLANNTVQDKDLLDLLG